VTSDAFTALLDAVGEPRRSELLADEARSRAFYTEAIAAAQEGLPLASVAPDVFARWVADRLPPNEEGAGAAGALASLRIDDLYLACACSSGRPEAIAAFEARYFGEVVLAVKRAPRALLAVDDVAQLVRERLFVGDGTRGPRISEYRGTGAMRSWLRVTVSRMVLNLATRGPRETPHDDDALGDLAVEGESSELALIKDKYRGEFRAAVQVALAALEPEARSLLTHAFAQGLSVDRIGAIYGIHRATAARRLQRARELFVEETRRALAHRLGGATAEEVDSIIGLIRSRFDVTLGGFLREGGSGDRDNGERGNGERE
jgi:RNA polymerase sigma-70 factor (ECF subfamily)